MTTELTDDVCDECGFDSSDRSREETIAVMAEAAELIKDALESTNGAMRNERPDETIWSPLEYVEHIREVFLHSRLICEQALAAPEQVYEGEFPPAMSEEPATLDEHRVLSALREEAKRTAEMFSTVSEDQWADAGIVSGMRWTLRFALPHICHELLHHRDDIAAQSAQSSQS